MKAKSPNVAVWFYPDGRIENAEFTELSETEYRAEYDGALTAGTLWLAFLTSSKENTTGAVMRGLSDLENPTTSKELNDILLEVAQFFYTLGLSRLPVVLAKDARDSGDERRHDFHLASG